MTRLWYFLPLVAVPLATACELSRDFKDSDGGSGGLGGGAGSGGTAGATVAGRGGTAGSAAGATSAGSGGTAGASGGAAGNAVTGGSAGQGGSTAGTAGTDQAGSGGAGAQNGGSSAGGGASGNCEVYSMRSCAEGDLSGPCAEGTQTCAADGTWGACSIAPEAEDTCEPGNDANCNGTPNDGCDCAPSTTRACADVVGNCAAGTQTCNQDGSGWSACSIQPQGADACTPGDDANCDGQPNGNCPCVQGATQPCGPEQIGICRRGTSTCEMDGTWGDCNGAVNAKARDCNSSQDNDCDGAPDDTIDGVCQCDLGSTRPCGTHPQDGTGICKAGTQACVALQSGAASNWSATCTGSQGPNPRQCSSSADNDCNGQADNTVDGTCKCSIGATRACDTHPQDGIGICKAGTQTCVAQSSGAASDWSTTCTGSQAPKARDCGTALDNDCDGTLDRGTGGPSFVKLPEGYCIDSTEVTRAQYQAWLNTNPSTGGQAVGCSSNTSFTPPSSCITGANTCQNGCSTHPQVCVDWCDAYAYCRGVGKRLCGHPSGGGVEQQNYANMAHSQWYNACTSHGTRTYPYGSTFNIDACNHYPGLGPEWTVPVASMSACQSSATGYAGVFDLSGNAAEWENSCASGSDDSLCSKRGGFFFDEDRSEGLKCAGSGTVVTGARNVADYGTGFRCCSY